MDPTDELLVLAHGIEVHHRALVSLQESEALGFPSSYATLGLLRRRLTSSAQQWWSTMHGDPTWQDENLARVVAEAHEWLDAHEYELEQLKERSEQ